ncbi:MAG: T9SS type A sorting domain-containing protein [Bacteroidales bacterium]|nr:T9SS type A sorting domain-containing protein [Bacteroidales bacterium]
MITFKKNLKTIATFVSCILLFSVMFSQDLPPGWGGYSNTPAFHTFILPVDVVPTIIDEEILYGDYIGAFFEDEGILKCGGATMYTGENNISVTAYADDSFITGKDGFYAGDSVFWKIYSYENIMEYHVFVEYDTGYIYNTSGRFTPMAISVFSYMSTDEFWSIGNTETKKLVISPNPAGDAIFMSIPGLKSEQEYMVYNITGKVVMKGIFSPPATDISLKNLSKGVYIVRTGPMTGRFIKY